MGGPQSRSGLFIYLFYLFIYLFIIIIIYFILFFWKGNKFIAPSWIQIPDLRASSAVAIPSTLPRHATVWEWSNEGAVEVDGHVARVGKEQKLDMICPWVAMTGLQQQALNFTCVICWKRRLRMQMFVKLYCIRQTIIILPILILILTYLLTATGLTPGGSSTVRIYSQTVHRTTQWNRVPRTGHVHNNKNT